MALEQMPSPQPSLRKHLSLGGCSLQSKTNTGLGAEGRDFWKKIELKEIKNKRRRKQEVITLRAILEVEGVAGVLSKAAKLFPGVGKCCGAVG